VGYVSSAVTGAYGSITINSNGSYTYVIDDSNAAVQALRLASQTLDDVFTYTVTDTAGLTSTTQLTVTIQGANDAPTNITAGVLSVAENSANGTSIGTAAGVDIDSGETFAYTLTDNAGGRFAINSTTGAITVANNALLNFEAATSHSIAVRVTDAAGLTFDKVFTVNLTDVDEFDVINPTDSDATANAVNENVAIGTVVGITTNATDADATTNTVTYSLFGNDGGNFTIDANTGVVTTAAALNRETLGASRNITVRATSADGSTADTVFTIAINDLDEFDIGPINDLVSNPNAVAENSATGTIVNYQAFTFDADATMNGVVYSLDDNANGRFAIDAVSGMVTVADGSRLNFEANTGHSIVVRATSDDGSSFVATVGIAVLNVNERPIALGDYYTTTFIDVLRVLRAGVLANDLDPDGDSLGFQIVSGPSTGQLVFSNDGSFAYMASAGFVGRVSFVYQAFDGLLASDPTVVTIDISMPIGPPSDPGTGGSGTGGSGTGGSGTGTGSGTTTTLPADTNATLSPIGVVSDVIVQAGLPVSSADEMRAGTMVRVEVKESNEYRLLDSVQGHRAGELAASISQRTLRGQLEGRNSRYRLNSIESGLVSEEFVLHGSVLAEGERSQENFDSISLVSFSLETAVSTAIGTGAILWVVQATQLAATLVSAAAPTWMQMDIASTLSNLAKEKSAKDEASAKIFE